MIDRRDRGIRVDDRAHPRDDRRIGALADQQPLGLAREQGGDQRQHQADRDRGDAVDPRILPGMARPDADSGDGEPRQRRRILEQHDESGRVLRLSHRLPPARAAIGGGELAHRQQPRAALHRKGDAENDIVDQRTGKRLRLGDMHPAFIDRHARADREDQDRDDEAPEIQLPPIAERMRLIRRPAAAMLAIEQQQLVEAVDDRMEPLGQHRGRARDRRGDELGDRNAEIGGERSQHDESWSRLALPSTIACSRFAPPPYAARGRRTSR